MRPGLRLLAAVALASWSALQACTTPPQPTASQAFFRVATQDEALAHAFVREQERQVQGCGEGPSCVRARYLLGLAALYKDRTMARTQFQTVLAAEPNGPYAASSRAWIQMLGRSLPVREGGLVEAVERVVRDLLDGETAIRRSGVRTERGDKSSGVLKEKESQAVQSLKRQLKEREEEIEVLTEQIEALKRVDQEIRERVKPGGRTE